MSSDPTPQLQQDDNIAAPTTGEMEQPSSEPAEDGLVVPLPPILTMGAASFTQQQQQQHEQRGGRSGGRQQQQHKLHQQQGPGRGRGGGRGRGPPSTPQQGSRGAGRVGNNVVSIAPTTGIPFGHIPAYLPGSSSLVEELNTRIMVILRDGRHLVGILRSFDQYSNMVLDEVSERKFHRSNDGVTYFADIPLGVYIARGDSMVLLGQVGSDDEGMKQIEMKELEDMIEKAKQEKLEWDFDKDLLA
ncbi:LSM domain containing protein [Nitzschia inconspicua]|uniref:U6 snRNA-associated Sm-like protein LSm1 n=1 Tax=Nitzschia inconspicua TaxID=303405 RepID=A0A9K3PNM4_9STRA|nr:LSM domain containing protein [Nitzschia inconspicua]